MLTKYIYIFLEISKTNVIKNNCLFIFVMKILTKFQKLAENVDVISIRTFLRLPQRLYILIHTCNEKAIYLQISI